MFPIPLHKHQIGLPFKKRLPSLVLRPLPKVIFNNKNAVFFQSLKEAADNYFAVKGIQRTGDARLYIKTAILFVAAFSFYFSVLFFSLPAWGIILFGFLLGFTSACIGFNVMH